MMNTIKKLLLSFSICILLVCSIFCVQNRSDNTAKAETFSSVKESVFIRNPEYSTIYQNKIYFYDSYDKKIKVYDNENEVFLNETISFSDYSVIDAVSYESSFIFLVKKEEQYSLSCLNLTNLEIKMIALESDFVYTKISAQNINDLEDNHFIIALTSLDSNSKYCPILIKLSSTYETLSSAKIKFDSTKANLTEIESDLTKILVSPSKNNDEINLIFIYQNKVSYSEISMTTLSQNEITLTKASIIYDSLDSTNSDITIGNINFIELENGTHLVITYDEQTESEVQTYLKLYSVVIDDAVNTKCIYTKTTECKSSKHLLINGQYIIYPSNQTITYKKINYNSSNDSYTSTASEIKNPEIQLVYYNESDFVYCSVNRSSAKLTKTPWDSEEIISIPEDYDIINIGYGKIMQTNEKISDYVYCFVTVENKNYFGYMELDNIENKNIIQTESYKYKVVRVVPNSNLYSAPTKVSGSTITDNLSSSIIMQIKDNSRIKILDVICEYTSNNTTFIKVSVNDENIGYIDVANIISPSEKIDFIITNCSLKSDTLVYQESSSGSSVIGSLKKGYRVRINGKRNTKTGITCITYNDEYGNEFTGYIKTDNLKTDTWSTLQIIGCILIAINIGLLILILIFKKNRIGKNGEKYLKSKKENYKVQD